MTKYFVLSIIEMKILFHILLDMNQKTKISTKFPRSKLGVATAVFSLGGVAIYSLGVINPLQASQSEYLQVDGVQNSVQYLTSLVIDSPTAKVEFKYDDASKAVRASGSLNMQNLVVGQGNESSTSSVVFWWTENDNQWANSVIVWGNSTINEGNNNVIVLSPGSKSSSENTAILNGQKVVTNGKNITVVNGENSKVRGNYVTVFGNSSVDADHVVVFGDKVTNNKSNTFAFNGQDAEFVPEQESAFYANSKVAINGDHANATLDVHGGMMIGHRKMGQSNTYTAWKNPATSGTIALFSKYGQTGLCGYDGKDNLRRVPLSESARKFWLCAPIRRIWDLPKNAVSNNQKKQFPQVWNQNKGHWEWESPKWIYGSKDKPQHFLCADGYVPDVADPIGKTGVKCIPCEWAKSGDLNCTTQKGDNSVAKPHCPPEAPYNETSKKCEGTKSTPCVAWDNIVRFSPDTQIETYNADIWIWQVTQRCKAVKCQEGYILEGERCVQAQCQGQLPENAIGSTVAWNVQWHYDATIKGACSFKCDDSSSDQKNKYFRIEDNSWGGSCKRCAEGLYDNNIKKCVKGVECPVGYQDDGNGKCQLVANCLSATSIVNVLDDDAEAPVNFRPLEQDMKWQYVDRRERLPSPNSCEFTCPEGMYPHPSTNFPKCYKPKCWEDSYASGNIAKFPDYRRGDYEKAWISFSINIGYKKYSTQPALDVDTLEEFKEKYKNKLGCWERCPGLKELKGITKDTDSACQELFKQKTPKTPETSGDEKPSCTAYKYVYGESAIKGSSSPSQTTERKIVWNTQEKNPPACTTYCPYDPKTWADLWFGGSDANDLFCLNPKKGCEFNQILDTYGKCVYCHGENIGDPTSAKLAGYPTKCIQPCTYVGGTYNSATGKCETKVSVDRKCPGGWTLENNKCVSSPSK